MKIQPNKTVEAAFQHKIWGQGMRMIVELGRPVVLVCAVEGELAANRHLQKTLKGNSIMATRGWQPIRPLA